MKTPQLLLLPLVLLLGAVSGCHTANESNQFSEVPDYMRSPAKPRKAMAALEITGARPGVQQAALVKGIRQALGPASNAYPEQEKTSDAQKLTESVLAGNKVTLRLPPDMASSMAHQLEAAGLIVRLTE